MTHRMARRYRLMVTATDVCGARSPTRFVIVSMHRTTAIVTARRRTGFGGGASKRRQFIQLNGKAAVISDGYSE